MLALASNPGQLRLTMDFFSRHYPTMLFLGYTGARTISFHGRTTTLQTGVEVSLDIANVAAPKSFRVRESGAYVVIIGWIFCVLRAE